MMRNKMAPTEKKPTPGLMYSLCWEYAQYSVAPQNQLNHQTPNCTEQVWSMTTKNADAQWLSTEEIDFLSKLDYSLQKLVLPLLMLSSLNFAEQAGPMTNEHKKRANIRLQWKLDFLFWRFAQ